MVPNGCMATSLPKIMNLMPCKTTFDRRVPDFSQKPAYLNVRNWRNASQQPQHLSLDAGGNTKSPTIISTSLQKGYHYSCLPRRRNYGVPMASNKYSPSRLNYYPPMTEKPKWWWRTLASIPYLIPLHGTWKCAEHAFHISPFLEQLEFFAESFNYFIWSIPGWFWMAYSIALYLGVVRRRQWPHFLRFHVVNSVLLENLLDTMIIVWMDATSCLPWPGRLALLDSHRSCLPLHRV